MKILTRKRKKKIIDEFCSLMSFVETKVSSDDLHRLTDIIWGVFPIYCPFDFQQMMMYAGFEGQLITIVHKKEIENMKDSLKRMYNWLNRVSQDFDDDFKTYNEIDKRLCYIGYLCGVNPSPNKDMVNVIELNSPIE